MIGFSEFSGCRTDQNDRGWVQVGCGLRGLERGFIGLEEGSDEEERSYGVDFESSFELCQRHVPDRAVLCYEDAMVDHEHG